MKLKDRNKGPVGGFIYRYKITRFNGLEFPAIVYGTTWNSLIENIKKDMRSNAHPIPADLEYEVEQQICERQPADRCWMQSGDVTANIIHSAARMIDKVAGTSLEKKAKGCKVCGKRRERMNKML
jgi:L-lactate utilization protein LutC